MPFLVLWAETRQDFQNKRGVPVYSLNEAAVMSNCSVATLRRALDENEIVAVPESFGRGSPFFFFEEEIDAFIKRRHGKHL